MVGAIASLNAALRWDLQDFDRGSRHIELTFKGLMASVAGMAEAFNRAGQRMTLGITAPTAALAAFTVNAASNLQELQSAFDYTFGSSAAVMNRWAETTGNAMGRATGEMQKGALAMGQLFKQAAPTEAAAARLSQRFAVLAQDAASFYNTSFDEALGKIRSGLSGESEPLRDFGVFLTEAAVKAKALELGMIKAGEELTEQGKIMARSVLITEQLGDATGDVERTAGSFANRVRALKANIQELSEEIGQRFLPYAERMVGWAQAAAQWIADLPPAVKDAAIGFALFAAAIGPVMLALGALAATVLPLFLANMGPVFVAISAIINPFGTAVVVLGKLAGEFGLVSRALGLLSSGATRFLGPWGLAIAAVISFSENIGSALTKIGNMVRDFLGPQIQAVIAEFGAAFSEIGVLFDDIARSQIGQFLSAAADAIGELVEAVLVLGGSMVIGAISAFLDILQGVAEYIRGVVDTVSKLLNGDWAGAWEAAGNVVARAATRIANLIRGVMPWLAGALDLMARLTGDGSSMPSSGGQRSGGIGGAINFVRTAAANSAGGAGDIGTGSYAMPSDRKAKGGRAGRGRSGPSAEDLAARREEIKLEQALAVARERGDEEAERALRRQIDLNSKVAQYKRAGLNAAAAAVAAEKDMAELDQARAVAQAREITTEERKLDIQLAELRNDYEGLKALKDEEFLERQILMWREKGLSLAEAERQAAQDLRNIDDARAEQTSRRLGEQEDARQIELARLRGDDPSVIIALEERRRRMEREDELRSGGMRPEDAEAQAMQEAADRSRAALTGTFRDTFRAGLQAAMNGDLGGFFKNWIETRAFDALAKVLDRLAEGLAGLVSGQGGGGGFMGMLTSALGLATSFSGSAASGASSAGSAVGNAVSSFGKRNPWIWNTPPISPGAPQFANGGWGTIKGFPGLDANTLSLNGNPIAKVSSGELLNVHQNSGGGGGSNYFDLRGAVMTQDLLDQMNAIGEQAAVRGGVLGAQGAIRQISRANGKALA